MLPAPSLHALKKTRPKSWLRRRATEWAKPLELAGRHLLQWLFGQLLRVRERPPLSTPVRRILVVRLDERVGNLLLLSPMLVAIRQLWPEAELDVFAHHKMAELIGKNALVQRVWPYRKIGLFGPDGVLRTLQRVRHERYDIAFDAGSFFGVAVTHPLVVRLSGAQQLVGPNRDPVRHMYHVRARVFGDDVSDIDQRLALLEPFSSQALGRAMLYRPAEVLTAMAAERRGWIADVLHGNCTLLFSVGARLATRRMPAESWRLLVQAAAQAGVAVCVIWGPGERELAEAVVSGTHATLAPATTLDEFALLAMHALGVVGHDTGTSHLAVAVGAPTCALFVLENPLRYGHYGAEHAVIDLRSGVTTEALLGPFSSWLQRRQTAASAPGVAAR